MTFGNNGTTYLLRKGYENINKIWLLGQYNRNWKTKQKHKSSVYLISNNGMVANAMKQKNIACHLCLSFVVSLPGLGPCLAQGLRIAARQNVRTPGSVVPRGLLCGKQGRSGIRYIYGSNQVRNASMVWYHSEARTNCEWRLSLSLIVFKTLDISIF